MIVFGELPGPLRELLSALREETAGLVVGRRDPGRSDTPLPTSGDLERELVPILVRRGFAHHVDLREILAFEGNVDHWSISYALRNHFVHDGGQLAGADFFEGLDSKAGFKISDDGWAHIEATARSYGADAIHQRASAAWPTTPRDDLRVVLDACERETDDALGILMGSACRALVAHIGLILGAD